MDVCTDLLTSSQFHKSALTIGVFDGMHCGHIKIINELKLKAEDHNIPAIVITFDPHPKSILNVNDADGLELLMSTYKKLEIFELGSKKC